MAVLSFPGSPSNGQTYTANGKTWRFNGTSWDSVTSTAPYYDAEDTYTTTSSITPAMGTYTFITITALAGSLTINNPTGTPTQGKRLIIRIKDDGNARALSFDTQYRATADLPLPTTTVAGKTLYLGFVWNNTDTKLDLVAMQNNF